MLLPVLANIISIVLRSLAFQIFRTVALCLIGAQFILSGCKQKSFRWRGGGPMPSWLGRGVLIGFGLFFLVSTFFLWNK
jgi:hypothetical protein